MHEFFVPTRDNVHPGVIETLQKNIQWYLEHGIEQLTVDEILAKCIGVHIGAFTIILEDGASLHHDDVAALVFNVHGVLVDARVWFNPVDGMEVPQETMLGTPVVDGSKRMA